MEFDFDLLEKRNLCAFFICEVAQWPPPNIYFFVWTVSLNGGDNLVKNGTMAPKSTLTPDGKS